MLATTLSSGVGLPAKEAMPPADAVSGSGGRLVERWRGGPPCCRHCSSTGKAELKGGTSPSVRRAESGLGLGWSLCDWTGWNIDRLPVTKDSPNVSTLKSGVLGAYADRKVSVGYVHGRRAVPDLGA